MNQQEEHHIDHTSSYHYGHHFKRDEVKMDDDDWKEMKKSSYQQPSKSTGGKNRRFSVVETEKWKNIFLYHQDHTREEETQPQQGDLQYQQQQNEASSQSQVHDLEDAQWREILGCQATYRDRVVSTPLPINPEKINGFVKRKSDPVQLPSSRRVSVVETEKWKNLFACDAHLNFRSAATMSTPSPTGREEDESWRQLFGCQPDPTSTPFSPPSPLKSLGQISKQNRSPQIHLSTITEKETETGSSSNGSGELPKPKLMTYLRSMMKSKAAKKKNQSKSPKSS
jgi:hypothetical protein